MVQLRGPLGGGLEAGRWAFDHGRRGSVNCAAGLGVCRSSYQQREREQSNRSVSLGLLLESDNEWRADRDQMRSE